MCIDLKWSFLKSTNTEKISTYNFFFGMLSIWTDIIADWNADWNADNRCNDAIGLGSASVGYGGHFGKYDTLIAGSYQA